MWRRVGAISAERIKIQLLSDAIPLKLFEPVAVTIRVILKSVCQSVSSKAFLGIGSLVFSENWHNVGGHV